MTDCISVTVQSYAYEHTLVVNRARQLYKNISMLFLFPVKGGKLTTGRNVEFATFTQNVMITTVFFITGSLLNIE